MNTPTNASSINFSDFFDDTNDDWEQKAKRLQARRWRHLRNA
jgi:hypothetical protein